MNKTLLIKIFSITIFLLVIFSFYQINQKNYEKHREILFNYVDHPEGLPTPEFAKKTSFWFSNLRADLYWLQTIQYIGGNAVSSEYKKYLFSIIHLVTELNPYFEKPYVIAQLLLPDYNPQYEDINEEQQEAYIQQAIEISEKWIKNFCDLEKIEKIKTENNINLITTEEKYKNPCKTNKIPYYLAYIYYFHKNDPITSSQYYKIAAANQDAPEWAKTMAAIMAWKWWEREKSVFMFLNIAQSLDQDGGECKVFSSELNKVAHGIFTYKQIPLSGEVIASIQKVRIETFWDFNEEVEEKQLWDTSCMNYLNKATRELNLAYIQNAHDQYFEETGKISKNAQELLDKWYINFLPTDFQQYKEQWVKYFFNSETGKYDYEMSQ